MALSFDRLTVELSGRTVLSDITATLTPGRVTAVLGPNGAGKSSLVRAAAGLIRPINGSVMLDGVDVGRMPIRERAQAIGYLPQDAVVHWNMAVTDLVALGRMPHRSGAAEDAAAIEAALAATGTTDLRDRRVRELSGGERARVLLARVLAGQPRWLLADEPLASLDPAHQLDALSMFRAAAQSGTGVLLVLHDLTQAARVADDVILLKESRILASGDRATVLTAANIADAFAVDIVAATDPHGLPIIVPIARVT